MLEGASIGGADKIKAIEALVLNASARNSVAGLASRLISNGLTICTAPRRKWWRCNRNPPDSEIQASPRVSPRRLVSAVQLVCGLGDLAALVAGTL